MLDKQSKYNVRFKVISIVKNKYKQGYNEMNSEEKNVLFMLDFLQTCNLLGPMQYPKNPFSPSLWKEIIQSKFNIKPLHSNKFIIYNYKFSLKRKLNKTKIEEKQKVRKPNKVRIQSPNRHLIKIWSNKIDNKLNISSFVFPFHACKLQERENKVIGFPIIKIHDK